MCAYILILPYATYFSREVTVTKPIMGTWLYTQWKLPAAADSHQPMTTNIMIANIIIHSPHTTIIHWVNHSSKTHSSIHHIPTNVNHLIHQDFLSEENNRGTAGCGKRQCLHTSGESDVDANSCPQLAHVLLSKLPQRFGEQKTKVQFSCGRWIFESFWREEAQVA